MASPQRSSRPPMRTTCNGTVIHGGGGGFSGMAAMNGRGGILPGGGGTPAVSTLPQIRRRGTTPCTGGIESLQIGRE